jgi:hypothetical protein
VTSFVYFVQEFIKDKKTSAVIEKTDIYSPSDKDIHRILTVKRIFLDSTKSNSYGFEFFLSNLNRKVAEAGQSLGIFLQHNFPFYKKKLFSIS